MKKKFFIGMFSILLILGLVMTSCSLDDPKGGSGSGSDSNPFEGTIWKGTIDGESATLVITSSSWSIIHDGHTSEGSYTYSGNTATFDGDFHGTATISGSTLRLNVEGEIITFSKM